MSFQNCLSRTAQLRNSYIEISRFIHRKQNSLSCSSSRTTRPRITRQTRLTYNFRQFSTSLISNSEIETAPEDNASQHAETASSDNLDSKSRADEAIRIYEKYGANKRARPSTTNWATLVEMNNERIDMNERKGNEQVKLYGYITSQRPTSYNTFLQLIDPHLKTSVQLVVDKPKRNAIGSESAVKRSKNSPPSDSLAPASVGDTQTKEEFTRSSKIHESLAGLKPHTPVYVLGRIVPRGLKRATSDDAHDGTSNTLPIVQDAYVGAVGQISHIEIRIDGIQPLNSFPNDLVAKHGTNFGPEQRHLQFRTDRELRRRLNQRSYAMAVSRKNLFLQDFTEIETPLLFKSTPEGAREFIVPTRKRGLAYALPQSPQQYKQLLMASGVSRYFQFAKCFRDEDLRADRQPEFTQLDMEMAFASANQVMDTVEILLLGSIWYAITGNLPYLPRYVPDDLKVLIPEPQNNNAHIPRLNYHTVMSLYGSDKPDTRLGSKISVVTDWVPDSLKGMLTSLENPVIEMMKINMHGTSPELSGKFVSSFMDSASSAQYVNNPDGMPGITVFDLRKPLSGLASFGHDGATKVEEHFRPEMGDILIVQTRRDAPISGGSTVLGNMRRDIITSAIEKGLRTPPVGVSMLWVVGFPLFSPLTEGEVGQAGNAGICSTHHPFTAPRAESDLAKLLTDPLSIIGDHYDLVINGVEVGGGSRRIHVAAMQELIFRDVLKMPQERVEDFRHLLNALESGCPPHAGFALGFDRLMTIMTDVSSVRDVIAFPKYADGEDKLVRSPAPLTRDQLSTYHLKISDEVEKEVPSKISVKA